MASIRKSPLSNRKGFSLLEIMIVTMIMAVMAVMASRSVKTAVMNKKKIDARLKTETVVFDALRLMSTDIERAFHYQYALYEMERQAMTEAASKQPQGNGGTNNAGGNNAGNPQQQVLDPASLVVPERRTQFIGRADSLHFTTLNHFRTTANAQEGNQIEVGYYLSPCKSRISGKSSTCLWRRNALIIDNDVTRDGNGTPLVENVTQLKFEYLSENINVKEWRSIWMTDANGDANTQNLYPFLVRITLEVHDKESKEIGAFKQTVVASVRFANNQDPAKRFANSAGRANGGSANAGTNNGGFNGGNTNIGTLNSGAGNSGPGGLIAPGGSNSGSGR